MIKLPFRAGRGNSTCSLMILLKVVQMDAYFNNDSGLIPEVKILTAIKKRNMNSIEINITSHCGLNIQIITNKKINAKNKNKQKVFKVFIKRHSKHNYINPKSRKPSTIKLQTAHISISNVHGGFYDYDSLWENSPQTPSLNKSIVAVIFRKKIKFYPNKKVIEKPR